MNELATLSNLNSSLLLVSSQNPYSDVSLNQFSNSLGYTVLELVFNSCRADKS